MAAVRKSLTEKQEREVFESWSRPVIRSGYVHNVLGIWFYDDEDTNTAWQAWRERAHIAGSFSVMPGKDPAYRALEDAISVCRGQLLECPTESIHVLQNCIAALDNLLRIQAMA